MSGVRIYIEGGGGNKQARALLRGGFNAFLKGLRAKTGAKGWQWNVILCGSRQSTYEDYQIALRKHPDSINILLIDAESPVEGTPWQHLIAQDQWHDPGKGDDYCHLMVQTVEAWLIADPDTLATYYEKGFRRDVLPRRIDVEAIPKQDVLQSLQRASEGSSKGKYHKIDHCADLLAMINATTVRGRATHCNRLFTTVLRLIEEG